MNVFQLEIVTPTSLLDQGKISYLRCPGLDGSFGIMHNHREGIIVLGVGEIKVETNGKVKWLATSGGFVEISQNRVKMLLETVEASKNIDTKRAEEALKRAKNRRVGSNKNIDEARRDIALLRAVNRLKISKK
jgi:F-type H+-transporting ATPase subunit epsilon